MSTRNIFVENYEGVPLVLTDASAVVLSNSGAIYGIREKISGDVVVAAGAATVNESTGLYTYTTSALDDDLVYEFVFKITKTNGDIEYVAGEMPTFTPTSDSAYATISEAQSYFDGRLNTDAWDDADASDRAKALIQSTRIIDRLNFRGTKTSDAQELQFPRDDDSTIPQDIKDACSEVALALLDGVDPEIEADNLFMVSQGYANVRSTYDRQAQAEHSVAGVPSVVAWRYLLPYLRDNRAVDLSRVN